MPSRPNRVPAPQKAARRSLGTARRRTQAERTEETRTRILKAASELIRRRGYARFRTADVAAEAGLSAGGATSPFPDQGLARRRHAGICIRASPGPQPPPRRRRQPATRPDRSRHRGRPRILLQRTLHGGDRYRAVDLDRPGRPQADPRHLPQGPPAGRDGLDRGAGGERCAGLACSRHRRTDAQSSSAAWHCARSGTTIQNGSTSCSRSGGE